jgi:hypothetical protein
MVRTPASTRFSSTLNDCRERTNVTGIEAALRNNLIGFRRQSTLPGHAGRNALTFEDATGGRRFRAGQKPGGKAEALAPRERGGYTAVPFPNPARDLVFNKIRQASRGGSD